MNRAAWILLAAYSLTAIGGCDQPARQIGLGRAPVGACDPHRQKRTPRSQPGAALPVVGRDHNTGLGGPVAIFIEGASLLACNRNS